MWMQKCKLKDWVNKQKTNLYLDEAENPKGKQKMDPKIQPGKPLGQTVWRNKELRQTEALNKHMM